MIFKIHYGLWYGGLVGIIPFTFNYAVNYCGATSIQHGILFTILPFLALIAKPLVCAYADKHAAHRRCLIISIYLTMLGYGSLAIWPFFTTLSKSSIWVLYCLGAALGNTAMCVVNSLGDSLAINSCNRKNTTYGQYRMWGPIGFGLFGAIWGLANTVPFLPPYTPGLLTMIAILATNSVILVLWRDATEFDVMLAPSDSLTAEPSTADQDNMETLTYSSRLRLLLKLGREHPSVFMYIFIFTFCGILTGIHWQFFFQFLLEIASDQGKDFSTITTLVLPVQSLGGELVFFMLAAKILDRLGGMITLIICLSSFAIRYLMYAYLITQVDIYWILPVELLQGPAFGLMYCVLTNQAHLYSEKIDVMLENGLMKRSLHATLQGTLGASFEGLGLGLGSLIGGLAFNVAPKLMWELAGYSALVVSIVYLIVGVLIGRKSNE